MTLFHTQNNSHPTLQVTKPWLRKFGTERVKEQEGGGGMERGLGHRQVLAHPCHTAPQLIRELSSSI